MTNRIVPPINDISLVNALAKKVEEWVKNLRFTIEKNTDRELQDAELNVSPQVFKYYFPKREDHKVENLPPQLRGSIPTPINNPLFPAIIIRPSDGSIDIDDNSKSYDDINIDMLILVEEYDVINRYEFLFIAKKTLIQNLRSIPNGILDSAYRLQKNITYKPYDDSQDPKAGLVITTTWRCHLPDLGAVNLSHFID